MKSKDLYYIIWNLIDRCWEVSHANNCLSMWDVEMYKKHAETALTPPTRVKVVCGEGYAAANKRAKNMPPFASLVA